MAFSEISDYSTPFCCYTTQFSFEGTATFVPQVDKVKNLRGGCSFLSRGGACVNFSFQGGITPPTTQKIFACGTC